MVRAWGEARIRHAETGEIYTIDSSQVDFEMVGSDDRQMGPEYAYSAVIEHPQLGHLEWMLWEYPIGAENYRETNIGAHELIEDISFGLTQEPEDGGWEEERQSRIETLVQWFHQNYEDPAERLPYISAEGGYQWIYGGPYDAREELWDNFPEESEEIIEAAVEEIEADGLTDWAPVSSPDDYDEEPPLEQQEVPLSDDAQREVIEELNSIINTLPDPQIDPVFSFGDDGLLHLDAPPDQRNIEDGNPLAEELRLATGDLLQSLQGTNAHLGLFHAVERYEEAISGQQFSVSRLYARGVRLDHAVNSTEEDISSGDLPPLPPRIKQHLSSVVELHSAYIMSQPEGRALAQGADAYRRPIQQSMALEEAIESLATAVERAPALFAAEVQEHVASIALSVNRGTQPERSSQVATNSITSVIAGLLKGVGKFGGFTVGLIVATAIPASIPGIAATAGAVTTINAVWTFLIENTASLSTLAALLGNDLTWLVALSHALNRIQLRRKK